jgi:DNA ligase 1
MSKRSGSMLCYPFEEKRLLKWRPPYIVQPKLDGERCRAVPNDNGSYNLLSSEENSFISVPHINAALRVSKLWPAELDGELYLHGMTFEEIHSIVSRTVNLHPDYKLMEYHIFDQVLEGEPQFMRIPYHRIWEIGNPVLVPVSSQVAETFEDVMREYDALIEQGYEGMVVRHWEAPYIRKRSTFLMKFKPKKSDYYKIIGYKEEVSIHGEPKGRLGALICRGDDGTTFSVGSGLNDNLREKYWDNPEELIGRLCHVAYQHITSGKGVPRFPIFIEVLESEPKEVGIRI